MRSNTSSDSNMTINPPAALPVAVIGAGPVGLAAAAHLVARGERPLVFEAGATVGASVRQWGHVRLFSPWRYVVDPVSRGLLEEAGWTMPPGDALPTGRELVERYLEPLARLPRLRPHLHLGRRVVSVGRLGLDKMKSAGREDAPFAVTVRTAEGREERHLVRAVIDASGTYAQPNPAGAGGLPAGGEREAAAHVHRGIPDVLGAERARYAGRRVLVLGSGHSALNALLELAELAGQAPGTRIAWAVRRGADGRLFGGGEKDALPARGSLGQRVRALVETDAVQLVAHFQLEELVQTEHGLVAVGAGRRLPAVDEVVVTTGFRPELSFLRELRLGLDAAVESPAALAPLIDPNLHSCGTVPPHGYAELAHPEKDFFIVGMKSYGRAPTFLLLTGYEQVRSVVAALTGDLEAAGRVHLVLPETGVCSSDGACELPLATGPRETSPGCCGAAAPEPAARGEPACCAPRPAARVEAACCAAP
jgi:hypothetical protein